LTAELLSGDEKLLEHQYIDVQLINRYYFRDFQGTPRTLSIVRHHLDDDLKPNCEIPHRRPGLDELHQTRRAARSGFWTTTDQTFHIIVGWIRKLCPHPRNLR